MEGFVLVGEPVLSSEGAGSRVELDATTIVQWPVTCCQFSDMNSALFDMSALQVTLRCDSFFTRGTASIQVDCYNLFE